jgi:hypothetical protein
VPTYAIALPNPVSKIVSGGSYGGFWIVVNLYDANSYLGMPVAGGVVLARHASDGRPRFLVPLELSPRPVSFATLWISATTADRRGGIWVTGAVWRTSLVCGSVVIGYPSPPFLCHLNSEGRFVSVRTFAPISATVDMASAGPSAVVLLASVPASLFEMDGLSAGGNFYMGYSGVVLMLVEQGATVVATRLLRHVPSVNTITYRSVYAYTKPSTLATDGAFLIVGTQPLPGL